MLRFLISPAPERFVDEVVLSLLCRGGGGGGDMWGQEKREREGTRDEEEVIHPWIKPIGNPQREQG